MPKQAKQTVYYGTGRRKEATARVFIKTGGTGNIMVNGRTLDEYFSRETAKMIINQALQVTNMLGSIDAKITVRGGGASGQAGAIRHGLSRALVAYDEDGTTPAVALTDEDDGEGSASFRRVLRKAGFMTRDSRAVERKKVGRHKARKGVQFSKR